MTRISVILFMLPFFNARIIPALSKAGLAFIITIVLFPVIGTGTGPFPATALGMARIILAEVCIGLTLGLLVQLIFEGVRIMGQLVGFQTGFAITNILDPQSGMQISVLSNMAYMVAVVFFLLLNGHHILLIALRESFQIVGVGSANLTRQTFEKIVSLSGQMFVIALKIGAPAIAALFFTQVAFGLVTKVIPQMNIMIVAFPVQIVVGLVFFGISLNGLLLFMERYVGKLHSLLLNSMALMGAG